MVHMHGHVHWSHQTLIGQFLDFCLKSWLSNPGQLVVNTHENLLSLVDSAWFSAAGWWDD